MLHILFGILEWRATKLGIHIFIKKHNNLVTVALPAIKFYK